MDVETPSQQKILRSSKRGVRQEVEVVHCRYPLTSLSPKSAEFEDLLYHYVIHLARAMKTANPTFFVIFLGLLVKSAVSSTTRILMDCEFAGTDVKALSPKVIRTVTKGLNRDLKIKNSTSRVIKIDFTGASVAGRRLDGDHFLRVYTNGACGIACEDEFESPPGDDAGRRSLQSQSKKTNLRSRNLKHQTRPLAQRVCDNLDGVPDPEACTCAILSKEKV